MSKHRVLFYYHAKGLGVQRSQICKKKKIFPLGDHFYVTGLQIDFW